MTVVLSMRCRDGIVVGADSQITEGSSNVSFPAQKLHHLGDRAAWGGSGARAVLHDLERIFDESAATIGEADVCRIDPDGAHHLDDDEIDGVRRQVERWAALEQQALDELFT